MLAQDIMKSPVITIQASATVNEAAAVLSSHQISGAPVVDANGKLVGMLTEHDLIRKSQEFQVGLTKERFGWLSPHTSPDDIARFTRGLWTVGELPVEQAMTRRVFTAQETDTVEDVARLMVKRRINRVPVMRDDQIVGIITRADLVWAMVSVCEMRPQPPA